MPSRTLQRPHVLILGAGLGGLALAQALRKLGITFEIFERDESPHARFQGWAIALHWMLQDLIDSMPNDLPPIDMTSHLLPLKIPAEFCLFHGEEKASFQSTEKRPILRANRTRLRDWLGTNIDIQWNRRMTRIEEDDTSVKLFFADGTYATGDVLVGADGVHSPVRKHLFGGENLLKTLPIGLINGQLILNKEQYERQMELSHSAFVFMGDEYHIFVGLDSIAEDLSSAKYYWFVNWHDAEAEHEPYWTVSASKQDLLEYAVKHTKSLDPKFTEVIRLTKADDIMMPPIVLRDIVLENMPNRRITLLGDAAHPMAPFRGEGGCQAIKDALNLARVLAKSDQASLQSSLKEYQDEMLPRGADAVQRSRTALENNGNGTREAWARDPPVKVSTSVGLAVH